jgi:hypothetical protein
MMAVKNHPKWPEWKTAIGRAAKAKVSMPPSATRRTPRPTSPVLAIQKRAYCARLVHSSRTVVSAKVNSLRRRSQSNIAAHDVFSEREPARTVTNYDSAV